MKNIVFLQPKFYGMHIDSNPIVDERLYAFWFDGDTGNIYSVTMEQLYDREWLWNFFKDNEKDLAFFNIAEINEAIERTIDDLERIDDFFLDCDSNLDDFFQNLSQSWQDSYFERSKGKLNKHKSWVRFYSIKIEPNIYILTGGTIKLTATMQEREHTKSQLGILKCCRDYLIGQGFCDFDGFYEFINENDI